MIYESLIFSFFISPKVGIFNSLRITHYAKMSDIQTAAMLCCVFSVKPEQKGIFNKNRNSKSVTATVSVGVLL